MNDTPNGRPSILAVGDKCKLLHGVSLYDVTIAEATTYLEDDPAAFTMYRVKSDYEWTRYFEENSQHRSDLFRWPDERMALAERLESDRDSLAALLSDVEEESQAINDAAEQEPAS